MQYIISVSKVSLMNTCIYIYCCKLYSYGLRYQCKYNNTCVDIPCCSSMTYHHFHYTRFRCQTVIKLKPLTPKHALFRIFGLTDYAKGVRPCSQLTVYDLIKQTALMTGV